MTGINFDMAFEIGRGGYFGVLRVSAVYFCFGKMIIPIKQSSTNNAEEKPFSAIECNRRSRPREPYKVSQNFSS
jgi:hypothetical protein